MDNIELILKNIEPIIMNCRKITKIPSWERDDYLQEGMIIALEMYHNKDKINNGESFNFYAFFKVRYSCFLIDKLRKAHAFKRKFDQPTYFEISEAYNIYDHKQNVTNTVMYHLLYDEIVNLLTPEELILFLTLKKGGGIDRNQKYKLKKKIIAYINKTI